MTKVKIIICTVLSLIISAICVLFFWNIQSVNNNNDVVMNRFEWAKLLGDKYGITTPNSSEDLIKDVNVQNEYYKYVQAGAEQHIYVEKEFDGNSALTGGFMVQTVINVFTPQKFKALLGQNSNRFQDFSEENCVNILIERGYFKKEERNQEITKQRATAFLESMDKLQQEFFNCEGYENNIFADDVVTLQDNEIVTCNTGATEITVNEGSMSSLKRGRIIVFGLGISKRMVARRIVSMDGTRLSLEEVQDINDILVSSEGAGPMELSFESLAEYYGKNLTANTDASMQVYIKDDIPKVQELGSSDAYKSNGFTVGIQLTIDDDNNVNPSVTVKQKAFPYGSFTIGKNELKNDDNEINKIEKEKDLSISAELDISDISVFEQHSLFRNISVSSAIKQKLTFTIEGQGEVRYNFLNIPLKKGILSGELKLYLVLTIDGKLSIVSDLSFGRELGFDREEGFINRPINVSTEDPSVEGEISAKGGAGIGIAIEVFGQKAFDANLDVCVECRYSTKAKIKNGGIVCKELGIGAPIISIGLFKDDGNIFKEAAHEFAKKINFSLDFEIINYDNAPFKRTWHWENGNLVEKCTCEGDDSLFEPLLQKSETNNGFEILKVSWDCVNFGQYWQNDTNGDGKVDQNDEREPIKWRVLSVDGSKIILISDKVLDYQKKRYNTKSYNNQILSGDTGDYYSDLHDWSWKDCTVRNWLNTVFINNAFSAKEQKCIVEERYREDESQADAPLCKISLPSSRDLNNEKYGFNSGWNSIADDEHWGTAYVQCLGTKAAVATDYAVEQVGKKAVSSSQDSQAALLVKNEGRFEFVEDKDGYLGSYELIDTAEGDASESCMMYDGNEQWYYISREAKANQIGTKAGIRPIITINLLDIPEGEKLVSYAGKYVAWDDADANHRFNRYAAG